MLPVCLHGTPSSYITVSVSETKTSRQRYCNQTAVGTVCTVRLVQEMQQGSCEEEMCKPYKAYDAENRERIQACSQIQAVVVENTFIAYLHTYIATSCLPATWCCTLCVPALANKNYMVLCGPTTLAITSLYTNNVPVAGDTTYPNFNLHLADACRCLEGPASIDNPRQWKSKPIFLHFTLT